MFILIFNVNVNVYDYDLYGYVDVVDVYFNGLHDYVCVPFFWWCWKPCFNKASVFRPIQVQENFTVIG